MSAPEATRSANFAAGLCAGDGGRLGAELTGAQISAHRATAAVDTKARYHRRLRTLVANFRCSRSRPWSGVSDRHSTAPPPFFDDFLYIAVATNRSDYPRTREGIRRILSWPEEVPLQAARMETGREFSFVGLLSLAQLISLGRPLLLIRDCFRTDRARQPGLMEHNMGQQR